MFRKQIAYLSIGLFFFFSVNGMDRPLRQPVITTITNESDTAVTLIEASQAGGATWEIPPKLLSERVLNIRFDASRPLSVIGKYHIELSADPKSILIKSEKGISKLNRREFETSKMKILENGIVRLIPEGATQVVPQRGFVAPVTIKATPTVQARPIPQVTPATGGVPTIPSTPTTSTENGQ